MLEIHPVTAVLAVACALSTGCRSNEPTVVIDDWWNVDFAKNNCKMRADTVNPCIPEPADEVHDFEARLVTAFAVDPVCHGVSIISWQGPNGPAARPVNGPRWQLMLDYTVGDSSQDWSMALSGKPVENSNYSKGTGNATQIIQSVCSIITHKGGAIAE